MSALLMSEGEFVRWLSGSLAVHKRTARELLARDDAPRPVVVAGSKRYKRAEIETWLANLPSVFGHDGVTGTKTGPTGQGRLC